MSELLQQPTGQSAQYHYCSEHKLYFYPSMKFENRCPACILEQDFDHMVIYYNKKLEECIARFKVSST